MDQNDLIKFGLELISTGETHTDYNHVVKKAKTYNALCTGDNVGSLLAPFIRREDASAFEQRCRLTQNITPAVISPTKQPYYKVARNKKVIKKLEPQDEVFTQKLETIQSDFYGDIDVDNGLDYFLGNNFVDLLFTDPNAWVVVEWDSFKPTELPKTRPFVVYSDEAVNFEYKNEVLQFLLVKNCITYKDIEGKKEVKKQGYKYTLYSKGYSIVYEQVSKNYLMLDNDLQLVEIQGNVFVIRSYETKLDFIPAFRIGYQKDLSTRGRTFTAPYEVAMPYLLKMVERVSELDLTHKLHTFPQKYEYVAPCVGDPVKQTKCHGGYDSEGSICSSCDGKGYTTHTSAQDIVILPLPSDKEDMIDLSGLSAYKSPPIELVEVQRSYINELKADVMKAMYNSDIFLQNQTKQTATEVDYDMESVYDTLTPFAHQYSRLYTRIVNTFIRLVNVDNDRNFKFVHRFPQDLKLRTMPMLLSQLTAINNSQAPSFLRDALNDDIAEATFGDNLHELQKYKVKKRFYPFNGKTFDEIQDAVLSENVTRFDKVLYYNFEKIFAELERDSKEFYYLKFNDQWKLVGVKVNELLNTLSEGDADRFEVADLGGINKTES